jgi:hypothetical protein
MESPIFLVNMFCLARASQPFKIIVTPAAYLKWSHRTETICIDWTQQKCAAHIIYQHTLCFGTLVDVPKQRIWDACVMIAWRKTAAYVLGVACRSWGSAEWGCPAARKFLMCDTAGHRCNIGGLEVRRLKNRLGLGRANAKAVACRNGISWVACNEVRWVDTAMGDARLGADEIIDGDAPIEEPTWPWAERALMQWPAGSGATWVTTISIIEGIL